MFYDMIQALIASIVAGNGLLLMLVVYGVLTGIKALTAETKYVTLVKRLLPIFAMVVGAGLGVLMGIAPSGMQSALTGLVLGVLTSGAYDALKGAITAIMESGLRPKSE